MLTQRSTELHTLTLLVIDRMGILLKAIQALATPVASVARKQHFLNMYRQAKETMPDFWSQFAQKQRVP